MKGNNALQIVSHYGLSVNLKTGFPHWKNTPSLGGNLDQKSMILKMGWASRAIEHGVERAHIIDRNCNVLPKTSNIHSRRMVLLHGGGADDNGKRRERASDDGAA
jgi:hypothetical protein